MLTLKTITENREFVREVASVEFFPDCVIGKAGKPTTRGAVLFWRPDGTVDSVYDPGTYYVMNASGSTVARYEITAGLSDMTA